MRGGVKHDMHGEHRAMPMMTGKPACPECLLGRVVEHASPARLSTKTIHAAMPDGAKAMKGRY